MARYSDRLHLAVRIVLVQILMAILIAAMVLAIKGWTAGYSFMLGAISSIIPTAVSSFITFKMNGRDANDVLITLYSATIVKYLLVAGLFSLILILIKPLVAIMVLAGLITMQVAVVLAPMLKN